MLDEKDILSLPNDEHYVASPSKIGQVATRDMVDDYEKAMNVLNPVEHNPGTSMSRHSDKVAGLCHCRLIDRPSISAEGAAKLKHLTALGCKCYCVCHSFWATFACGLSVHLENKAGSVSPALDAIIRMPCAGNTSGRRSTRARRRPNPVPRSVAARDFF